MFTSYSRCKAIRDPLAVNHNEKRKSIIAVTLSICAAFFWATVPLLGWFYYLINFYNIKVIIKIESNN
jgi:hypothetical protein